MKTTLEHMVEVVKTSLEYVSSCITLKDKTIPPLPRYAKLNDLALLVIDVQSQFCDPKNHRGNTHTERTAERIKRMIPEFRKACVPVYVIYFSRDEKPIDKIDFYQFAPEKSDIIVRKTADSAFQGSMIGDILSAHRRKKILACGFNLGACVMRTVLDAKKEGYDVQVLRDLSENDNENYRGKGTTENIRQMMQQGIEMTRAEQALKTCRQVNAANSNMAPWSKKQMIEKTDA